MALATLSIDLVAQLAKLESGLDKAGRLAEKQANQIERAFSGLKVVGAGLGGVIAGAFSVDAIETFFRATIDGIDALNDLADATGASIENISALEDVALRTGTSYETVATALVKLNGVLKDANPGSEQAEALKAIGLSAEELKRIDPAEAMLKVAQALAQYRDDGNKARIVQELFGKSIQEVAPLLKDLAEQGKLNGTVTKEQAEAAEAFNKELAKLSKNITDVSRGVVGDMLPSLNKAIEIWKELGTLGAIRFNMNRSPFENGLTEFQKARDELAKKQQELANFVPSTGIYGTNNEAQREKLKEDIAELEKLVKTRRLLLGLDDSAGAGRGGAGPELPPAPDVPDASGKAKKGQKPPKAEKPEFVGPELPEATKAALDALAGSDLAKAKQTTASIAELDSLFAAGLVNAQDYAAAVDKIRGSAAAGPILPEEEVARIKHLNDLLSATPTAQLEASRKEMQFLADALERGSITAEQFSEAVQTRLGTLPEKFKDSTDKMTVFAEEAARNIQDALGDTILQAMEGDFDSIGDSWKRMLNRMVSEALAADIGNALFPGGKPSFMSAFGQAGGQGGGSGLVNLLGSLGTFFGAENPSSSFAVNGSDFGFTLAGGATDPSSAFAVNGSDFGFDFAAALPSYDVGTAFVPEDQIAKVHKGERIIPAAQNRSGEWGGTVIHNNPSIYIDGRLDQAATAQLINQALAANNRALEERMAAQGRR